MKSIFLYITLTGLFFGVVKVIPWAETSSGTILFAKISAGAAVFLGPIFIGAILETFLTRHAVTTAVRKWCNAQQTVFEQLDTHKNHFTVIFSENGQKQRAKFRVKFAQMTWKVREITWL